ncbi:MAG: aminotransferase class I/II-fold pyridoxal phosphate-dependent enzyme, partial [Planctomycetes bacterium]|nr:aminotransferase class I/II-fold pyridoxal phosphate-dependent enzyme [Planctomycetota bacterium]
MPVAGGGEGEHPLELSPQAMRRLVDLAMERIVPFVESLPRQKASNLERADEAARAVAQELPEKGRELAKVLGLLFDQAVPKGFGTAGPGYLAYIPGGGLFQSAVADLIGDTVNRFVPLWAAAPGLATIEADVVRWFARIVGYPPQARGYLTSGGSLANFGALFAARKERLGDDLASATIYASDQTHHSILRAAILAGFPEASGREIPSDGRFRIRLDLLAETIRGDRAAGRRPFLVVGNAGTTNTGAVDDLPALAELAAREGLWLHADAAYGGFFLLTDRGRRALAGIERADSVVLDPHKGLFLPYGTGALLVRDGEVLRRAHAVRADYLPAMAPEEEKVDFCQISPELSRGFRGLRVWLPFLMHGAGAFRRELDEKLDLALWAESELRRIPGIEIVAA